MEPNKEVQTQNINVTEHSVELKIPFNFKRKGVNYSISCYGRNKLKSVNLLYFYPRTNQMSILFLTNDLIIFARLRS